MQNYLALFFQLRFQFSDLENLYFVTSYGKIVGCILLHPLSRPPFMKLAKNFNSSSSFYSTLRHKTVSKMLLKRLNGWEFSISYPIFEHCLTSPQQLFGSSKLVYLNSEWKMLSNGTSSSHQPFLMKIPTIWASAGLEGSFCEWTEWCFLEIGIRTPTVETSPKFQPAW